MTGFNSIYMIKRRSVYNIQLTSLRQMDYLIKNTTLAIAIRQAINEIGIQNQQETIFKLFKESFNSKYEIFKKQNVVNSTLKGSIFNNCEYPIGEDDRQQYYTGIGYQAKINGLKLNEMVSQQRRTLILIEGYSKNEDPKRKNTVKSGSKKQKQKSLDPMKKKVKKN